MPATVANSVELINKYQLDKNGEWDDVLWERLVRRVMKDNPEFPRFLAEQVMDQAIGFLCVIALNPGKMFSPAPLPDIGWHTFLLYTREYMAFCQRVAGRYIHHSPFDGPGGESSEPVECPECTARHMREAGIGVIDSLWLPEQPKKRPRPWLLRR